ncbi:MAG: S9 family peptidase, partial [Geodermatophilaceae bacterium]|nr:S9 family peptidase [Geodermatophilaceae bacterium]
EGLREGLSRLLATGSVGAPAVRGERLFHTRREPGQEHSVLLVQERDGTRRALVDPGAIDPAGTTTLDGWVPSIEGERLAYLLSTGGDEESRMYVLDVATGEPVEGPIDRCRYSAISWLPGGEQLFYVRRRPAHELPAGEESFHRRVYRHIVGSDPEHDVEVHGAGLDPTNYYDVRVSREGRWLIVSASAGTAPRDDVWIADLHADADLRPVQVGQDARCAAWIGYDGRLWLFTDRDAPRGRLCVTDPTTPGYDTWREAVPESPDAVLDHVGLLRGADDAVQVLAAHSRDASSRVSVLDPSTGQRIASLALPGIGTVDGITVDPAGGPRAWVGYTDYATPPQVLAWDAASPEQTTLWAAAPGAIPPLDVAVHETTATSADGTPVHLFVLAPGGSSRSPRPTVLYGYGGFDIALQPAFTPTALAWVAAGGVWAVANLRGGSEYGQQWHRDGMREHKENVFDDFSAAAGALVAEGWTTPEQLACMGGSNGGLLVGAALTREPARFAAVVCSAPLLDMVRYELFGLGRTWNDEYGTAADPQELDWLLGYSPYHHVVAGTAYPATLFTTFDADTRVDPLHARKMCAAMQHASTSPAPVLLRREIDVGHSARSVSRSRDLAVDQLAFLAAHTGLDLRGSGT